MPDDNSAAWAAAGQIASVAATQIGQGMYRKKQAQFAKEQSEQSHQWAIEDWNRVNEYNHPSNVMARLREAGLNPNLAYGKIDTTSPAIRSPEMAHIPNHEGPDFSGLAGLGLTILDAKAKQAQIDNLRSQNTVIQQQALMLEAQRKLIDPKVEATQASTRLTNLIADLKNANFITDVSYRKAQLAKLVADTNYTINQDARAAAKTTADINEIVARTLNLNYEREKVAPVRIAEMNARIKNMGVSTQLLQLDRDLKAKGIYPGDPWYTRVAARAADTLKEELDNPDKPLRAIMGDANKYAPIPWPF